MGDLLRNGHIGLNRQPVAHRRRLQINSRATLSARLNIYCQCVDRHGLRCYDSCMPRLLCHHFSRCVAGPSVVDMCTQGALGNPSWSLPSLCRCCEATNEFAPQASVSLYSFQSCVSVIMAAHPRSSARSLSLSRSAMQYLLRQMQLEQRVRMMARILRGTCVHSASSAAMQALMPCSACVH